MIAKEDAVEVLSLLTNWRTKFMRMGDLSGNELLTLRAVINRKEAGAPDYTMGDLADYIDVTKSAASQLVGRLEEKGFLVRYMPRDDRRVVRVKMTDVGGNTYGTFRKGLDSIFAEYVELMGEEDTETLIRLIRKSNEISSRMAAEKK